MWWLEPPNDASTHDPPKQQIVWPRAARQYYKGRDYLRAHPHPPKLGVFIQNPETPSPARYQTDHFKTKKITIQSIRKTIEKQRDGDFFSEEPLQKSYLHKKQPMSLPRFAEQKIIAIPPKIVSKYSVKYEKEQTNKVRVRSLSILVKPKVIGLVGPGSYRIERGFSKISKPSRRARSVI